MTDSLTQPRATMNAAGIAAIAGFFGALVGGVGAIAGGYITANSQLEIAKLQERTAALNAKTQERATQAEILKFATANGENAMNNIAFWIRIKVLELPVAANDLKKAWSECVQPPSKACLEGLK